MDFAFGLSLVTSFLTVFLFLSPGDLIRKIRQGKSAEGFNLVPFVCMVANNWLWSWYGLLINQPVIYFLNSVGGFITLYYIINFYAFIPDKDLKKANILIFSVLGFLSLLTGITQFFFSYAATDVSGTAAVIGNVIALGSPLLNLIRVIRTKSTHTMSLPLAISSSGLGSLWFLYGYLVDDVYIMLPNALAVCFGLIQLVVYFIFGKVRLSVASVKELVSLKQSRSTEGLMNTGDMEDNHTADPL